MSTPRAPSFHDPSRFPSPAEASEDGIVAVGGELSTELLLDAYAHGIFPWPHDGYPLLWFSPAERGVIDFADLRVPRSLAKSERKLVPSQLHFTRNTAFARVIESCQKTPRAGQKGTWITDAMRAAYTGLFEDGYAFSIEAWRETNLVGGVYGVEVNGVVSAESMFHLEPDVSKLCILHLIRLLASRGQTWMDIQMTTPVTTGLGGKLIRRETFLGRLRTRASL
jgi:leucyl/phenylalanyl-tRNA--protein transferase